MKLPKNNKHNLIPIVTSMVVPDGTLFEMLHDISKQQTRLLRWHDGQIDIEDSFEDQNGIKLEPYSPYNPLLSKKLILFPKEPTEYRSKEELLADVQDFIHRYVDLPDTFELIAAYYVLLTWLFDKFNEIPYLRVRGDYGSGKTRFLQTVGSICYKPIFASGASTVAPLFHNLNQIGGTLILDEGDFRFSDEKADIAKILNNGNAKGFPVLRCEKINQREFAPVAYDVFGPKVVSSRNDYDDKALESRFICEDVGLKKVRKKIPITLPDSFHEEALELRNRLLLWRLENFSKVERIDASINRGIHLRLNQIYAPLLTLVSNQSHRRKIVSFARTQHLQNTVDAGRSVEADILEIIKIISIKSDQPASISEITKLFVQTYGVEYDRKITHRFVGSVIRKKLRLKTRKSNGLYILSENQKDKLKYLFEKYGL